MLGLFYLKNNESIFQVSFSSTSEDYVQNLKAVVHFILGAFMFL
jgi:hypothetical protein